MIIGWAKGDSNFHVILLEHWKARVKKLISSFTAQASHWVLVTRAMKANLNPVNSHISSNKVLTIGILFIIATSFAISSFSSATLIAFNFVHAM